MASPLDIQRLDTALADTLALAAKVRSLTQMYRTAAAAAPMNRQSFLDFHRSLSDALDKWADLTATPGLADYARSIYNMPGMDIVTWFSGVRSAATSLQSWLYTNVVQPVNAGTITLVQYQQDGALPPVAQQFTVAQMAPFLAPCDAMLTSLNASA